jgi:hypothetical protein
VQNAWLPASVAVGDFNGDLAPDLDGANFDSNTVSVLLNQSAVPTRLRVSAPPSSTAGNPLPVNVTALTQFGGIAAAYSGIVHFSSSDGQASLPADSTLTNGTGTFSATLKTAGTQSLSATDTVNGSLTGSAAVRVNSAAPDHLRFGNPGTVTAGNPFPFRVTVQDAYDNTATGYTGTVHFTATNGGHADYAFTTADGGQHTFTVAVYRVQTLTITGMDTTNGSVAGSTSLTVTPAAASSLVVAGYPSPTVKGVAHDFTVTALDPYGNVATGYRGTVHFSSDERLATLPADYSFAAADAGTHTFRAAFNRLGTFSLTATDRLAPDITGTQSGIVVVRRPPPGDSPPAAPSWGAVTPFGIGGLDWVGVVSRKHPTDWWELTGLF